MPLRRGVYCPAGNRECTAPLQPSGALWHHCYSHYRYRCDDHTCWQPWSLRLPQEQRFRRHQLPEAVTMHGHGLTISVGIGTTAVMS